MFSAELKKPAIKFLKSVKDKTVLKRIANKIYIEKIDKRSRAYD